MKHTIIILLVTCLNQISYGQEGLLPVDATTKKICYTDIAEAPGVSKKALFDKAKKWILTKNSAITPYTISFDNENDGSIVGKGAFMLPGDRRKYVVQFVINIAVKDNRYKYDLTDFIIQYKTEAGSSSGGYGYWGHSSYREAETLEYSLETFYPSRLDSRKPSIKWYEEITKKSFIEINKSMQSITNSLKQTVSTKEDW